MKLFISFCLLMIASFAVAAQAPEYKKFSADADVPRITIEDAKKAYDDKNVVIVDARASDTYKQEHIKGAISIPLGTDEKFDSLPKGKKIIVYCS